MSSSGVIPLCSAAFSSFPTSLLGNCNLSFAFIRHVYHGGLDTGCPTRFIFAERFEEKRRDQRTPPAGIRGPKSRVLPAAPDGARYWERAAFHQISNFAGGPNETLNFVKTIYELEFQSTSKIPTSQKTCRS